jgi:integrase
MLPELRSAMSGKSKAKRISTVTQVESLKPREDRYEVADAKIPSNRLVVFPSGSKSWVFRYRHGGRTRKMTLEAGATDLARARELGMAALNAVKAGIDPGEVKQEKKRTGSPVTIETLIDKFAEKHLGKRKDPDTGTISYSLRSGDEVERILRKELAPYLKRQANGGISESEAISLIDAAGKRGDVIRNRTLANLKSLFAFAMTPGIKAAMSNPFGGLKLKKVDDRERVLSEEELKAVWTGVGKLGEPYTSILRLLILTGQRLSEIADLRWSEVNLGKKQLELPGARTKNKRAHIVALSPPAVEILELARDNKIQSELGLVFTVSGDPLNGWSKLRQRLYKAVQDALEKSPADWVIHDIRRSVATHMAEDLKISPHIIDRILNHSTGVIKGVMATYNRAEYLDERRAALEAWGHYVGQLNSSPLSIAPVA